MASYILSDPNMSDGTHPEVIEAIMDQLRGREGMKLIGYAPDPDFDCLPAEILGRPEVMREALLDMAGKAYELIDMERQHGRHPLVGAVDTIEVYPAKGISIEEVREFCEDLGRELFARYEVPIYFTGKNARRPQNESLTSIRKGSYAGLKEAVLVDPERAPDIGPTKLHPTAGATIVGALEEHDVYFNVVLDTDDLEIARHLAACLRDPSRGLTGVQGAIGLPQTHRRTGKRVVAVSLEISDPRRTPVHRVFDLIRDEAARRGVDVLAGQICGTVGAEVLAQTAEWYLKLEAVNGPWDFKTQVLENHLLELES